MKTDDDEAFAMCRALVRDLSNNICSEVPFYFLLA